MTSVHRPDHSRSEVSSAELRRTLRADAAKASAEMRAMSRTMEALLSSDTTSEQRTAALLGRRRFFAIGGASVATAALLAACGGDDGDIGRVGDAPEASALPDPVVNDVVLLRTASSLEHSAIQIYDTVIDNADLLDPAYNDIAKRFRDDHEGHAALFEKLTKEAGGVPWTSGNPRLDEVVLLPILRAITGADATDVLAATQPSDDPKRDVLNLAHALETLAGETYQALVPVLSVPSLRKEAVIIGTHEVRHAAVLAIAITGRPDGYIDPASIEEATGSAPTTTAAPTTTQDIAASSDTAAEGAEPTPVATPIPTVYAIPAQFGQLGAVQVVVGAPNDSGTRVTVNLETPSLNSFVYEYLTEG